MPDSDQRRPATSTEDDDSNFDVWYTVCDETHFARLGEKSTAS